MKPNLIDSEDDTWIWSEGAEGYYCPGKGITGPRSYPFIEQWYGPVTEEGEGPRRWERPIIPANVTRIKASNSNGSVFLTRDGDEWVSDSGAYYDADDLWQSYEVIEEVIESKYDQAVAYFRNNFPRINEVDPGYWAPTTETKKHMITLINTALEVEGTK